MNATLTVGRMDLGVLVSEIAGFGLPLEGNSWSDGPWVAMDNGRVRVVFYPDDERAEVIVFDRPAGNVMYRVGFSSGTPLRVFVTAVKTRRGRGVPVSPALVVADATTEDRLVPELWRPQAASLARLGIETVWLVDPAADRIAAVSLVDTWASRYADLPVAATDLTGPLAPWNQPTRALVWAACPDPD